MFAEEMMEKVDLFYIDFLVMCCIFINKPNFSFNYIYNTYTILHRKSTDNFNKYFPINSFHTQT